MTLQEQFETLDLITVKRYVSEHKAENLQLEFKAVADQTMRNQDDKKNFAKALSGFANSDGGIVVWGVQTDKIDDVDVAISERPVPNVQALEGRLLELESEAVSPSVDGIRHKALQRPDGSGFVATLAPASDRGPHMAKLGENRYYKRSGTSFRPCEHFDLEDMFGRRPKPKLELFTKVTAQILSPTSSEKTYRFVVLIGIHNTGRGIARYPFLALSVSPIGLNEWGLDGNGRNGLPILVTDWGSDYQTTFAGGADSIIHVGSRIDVTRSRDRQVQSTSQVEPVTMRFQLCAEGIAPFRGSLIISAQEILSAIEQMPNFMGWTH